MFLLHLLLKILTKSSVLTILSREEGYGIVIHEALLYGLNIISYDLKILRNLFSNFKQVYFIKKFNILNYAKIKDGSHERFKISLKYHNSSPVLTEISVISKPGRKVYCNSKDIPLVKNGLGMVLISTSQGVVTDYVARTKNLGGEILLKIF